jgi:hypothetical protein
MVKGAEGFGLNSPRKGNVTKPLYSITRAKGHPRDLRLRPLSEDERYSGIGQGMNFFNSEMTYLRHARKKKWV